MRNGYHNKLVKLRFTEPEFRRIGRPLFLGVARTNDVNGLVTIEPFDEDGPNRYTVAHTKGNKTYPHSIAFHPRWLPKGLKPFGMEDTTVLGDRGSDTFLVLRSPMVTPIKHYSTVTKKKKTKTEVYNFDEFANAISVVNRFVRGLRPRIVINISEDGYLTFGGA